MTRNQLKDLGEKLVALSAVFFPAQAASVRSLMLAGAELTELLSQVKQEHPDVWAAVSQDFINAHKGLRDAAKDSQ
jgi:hypothetical protein